MLEPLLRNQKLIPVFHDPHRKGRSSPPAMALKLDHSSLNPRRIAQSCSHIPITGTHIMEWTLISNILTWVPYLEHKSPYQCTDQREGMRCPSENLKRQLIWTQRWGCFWSTSHQLPFDFQIQPVGSIINIWHFHYFLLWENAKETYIHFPC